MKGRRGNLIAVAHAARVLGVHPRTLRRWIVADVIRGTRVRVYRPPDKRRRWFVYREALEAFTRARGTREGDRDHEQQEGPEVERDDHEE